MPNQVLIVAAETIARTPARIVRSLRFEPVVVPSEEEAVALIGAQPFSLIAVSDDNAWKRVRKAAEEKKPKPRVVVLPREASDEGAVRLLLTRYLDPTLNVERSHFSEEHYRTLMKILESFGPTLDAREIVRRIVAITREELGADRAWLLHPVTEEAEYARVAVAVAGPAMQDARPNGGLVPLGGSRDLIRRVMESPLPVVAHRGEGDLDANLARRYGICSELLQILRPGAGEPWAFGLDQCTGPRSWSSAEIALFGEIGRVATLALNNTLLHARAARDVARKANREIEALADMMAERSARLDSILSSMTDGLWVYDAAGKVVDVNQAALTMFGFGSRTEAVEQGSFQAAQLRSPDGRVIKAHELPQARALRGEIVPDYLAVGRHAISGKDLDLSIAATPIESGGVVGAVLVIRDITALQELDRKKDEFLSVASHELRTPLTTIKGYTQLLAQTANELPPNDRSSYLTAVLGEIDRMMGLISELLDVSRIETNRLQIHPQPIRWREFLERRASAFRVQNAVRNIRLETSIPESRVVSVDPDRMRQVIDNLLSNAVKYSPDGSDIEISAALENDSMVTSVADHGIGIPKDELPQLFERFHRARNVSSRYYGGLGLGLYISKAIIDAHRGSISVAGEEGKGTKITIRVPLPPAS